MNKKSKKALLEMNGKATRPARRERGWSLTMCTHALRMVLIRWIHTPEGVYAAPLASSFFFLLSFYILNEASTRAVYWWDQRAQEKNRTLRTILMWTRAYKTKSFQKYMCLCVCGDVSVCLNRTRWLWRHLMFDIALNGTYTQTWSKYSIEKKKWNKERENKKWVNSPCLIRERSIFFFIRLCAGCV